MLQSCEVDLNKLLGDGKLSTDSSYGSQSLCSVMDVGKLCQNNEKEQPKFNTKDKEKILDGDMMK